MTATDVPTRRRRVRVAAVVVLGCVIGLSGWLRFGYERSPDPERLTVVAARPDVTFTLERHPGDPAAAHEVSGDGFAPGPGGSWVATARAARITYSGTVGTRAMLRFVTGPDQGRAVVSTADGPVRTVELSADAPGTRVVVVDAPLRLQPATLLLLALAIGIGIAVAWVVVGVVEALVVRLGVRRAVLVLAAPAIVAAVLVAWWVPAPRVQRYDIAVEHPGGPPGGEVRVRLERAGGVPRSAFADFFGGPGWIHAGGASVSTQAGARTRWVGMASPDDHLVVEADDPIRRVEVRVGDRTGTLTLDGPGRRAASVRLADLGAPGGALDQAAPWAAAVGDAVLWWVGLVLAGAVVVIGWRWSRGARARDRDAKPHPSTGDDASWPLTFALAAVPLVGWLALLAIFWPGPMNPDAMSQWFQVEDGVLADWHPYVLALVFAGTRQIVDSPWLPILLVTLGASMLVGRIAAWAVARGRPVRSAAAWLVVLLVVPATALHTVTLWKDSFYGVGLLALVLCIWRIEDTRGAWLARPANLALLAATCTGTWLVRHNGWPVVLGSLLVVALAHRAWWRRFAVVGVAVVVLVGFVQVPLARVLDVGPNPVDEIVYVQHVSLHLEDGTELTASERRFLESIRPLDEPWPYDCSTIQATWSGPEVIPIDDYLAKGARLRSLAIRLALRNPGAELRHLACASKLVWQPWTAGTYTYFMEWYDNGGRIDYLPVWLDRSPMEEPGNTGLAVAVFRVVERMPDWFVRPAAFLWLLLAATVVSVRRVGSWAPVRVAMPAFLQSAALALVALVQDVRFQYGVVLIAVVLTPLYLTARAGDGPAEPPMVWRDWRRRSGASARDDRDRGSEALDGEALSHR